MLSLTRKTDYGLIALSCLADEPEALLSAREMAGRFGLSLPLLMNVLKQLCTAGLVRSVRGAHGGYSLARSAGEITLSELIQTLEGPVRLAPCVNGAKGGGCEVGAICPMQGPLQRLHDRLQEFFGSITLAELAAEPHQAPAGE
jgi:Rrf2 family protein